MATRDQQIHAALSGDQAAFGHLAEPHRRELLVHCYRMLGSIQDAEDAVQETMLRAWRGLRTFDGRAPFRAWLYRIATNVSLDALRKRTRRTLPSMASPPSDPEAPFLPPVLEPVWLEPIPDAWLPAPAENPEARYALRETVTLAFLVALQALPPRQRVVLILRDVLGWRAREVASFLKTSTSAVNSALFRARATLAQFGDLPAGGLPLETGTDPDLETLLARYVEAWENAEIEALTSLLHEDATFTMPPSPTWYAGRGAVRAGFRTHLFPPGARGIWRLQPTRANLQPAFGLYQRVAGSAVYQPFALQVLQFRDGAVSAITNFISADLFDRFSLPPSISM